VSDITKLEYGDGGMQKNHVTVNGLVAKPSKEVFPTDKVTFRKDQITQIITVLDIPESRVGLNWLICIRNDTPAESFQHLELLKLSKQHYRKNGTGRPTKKIEEISMSLEMK
jgi:ribosome-associated heat shock protein Hsp15